MMFGAWEAAAAVRRAVRLAVAAGVIVVLALAGLAALAVESCSPG